MGIEMWFCKMQDCQLFSLKPGEIIIKIPDKTIAKNGQNYMRAWEECHLHESHAKCPEDG